MQRVRHHIMSENRYIETNKFDFDVNELVTENTNLTEKLIELKTKINKANGSIQVKIFELSELKAWLNTFQSLNVKSGKDVVGGYGSQATEVYAVQITAKDKETKMKELRKRIDAVQDELDHYNATHSIEISFDPNDID